jgi:hypothetical protein
MDKLTITEQVRVEKKISELLLSVNNKVNSKTIVDSVEFLDTHKNIDGKTKKQIALYIIEQIAFRIKQADIDMEFISETIDVMIDISRGKFNINKIVPLSQKIISKVGGCCGK